MPDESLHQDFDGCVTLYKDFVKQSSADNSQSLGILASSTKNSSGNKSVTFLPEERYYDSNEWYALSESDEDKVLKAYSNINGGEKSTRSRGHSDSGGGINNGRRKWKSKIEMLEKKVRNQKKNLPVFNNEATNGS